MHAMGEKRDGGWTVPSPSFTLHLRTHESKIDKQRETRLTRDTRRHEKRRSKTTKKKGAERVSGGTGKEWGGEAHTPQKKHSRTDAKKRE